MTNQEWIPILLSLVAGLATAVGAGFAIYFQKENKRALCISLGFAGGVMFVLSFLELLPEGVTLIQSQMNETMGLLMVGLSFMLGMLIASLVDKTMGEKDGSAKENEKFYKLGLTTTVAMMLHNFPEGVITFIAGYQDIRLGFIVALGIILHNIPEGVAIGAPIYYATKSRKKAVGYSLIAGLSEPLAAVLTMVFFRNYITDFILGLSLSFVAGIMVNIAVYELMKTAVKESKGAAFGSFALGGVFMGFIMFFL